MPSIAEKHDHLGGQVYRYAHTTQGWFFRLYSKETRSYKVGKIVGASSLVEAQRDAHKVLLGFQQHQLSNRKKGTKQRVETLTSQVEAFHLWEQKRVEAGMKDELCAHKRRVSMRRMLDYLKVKAIENASQIDVLTFEDYPLFRQGKMKQTIKGELKDIGVFFRSYLQPRGVVSNELVWDKRFLPKITLTDEDLDANPAITPQDYKVINHYIRNKWLPAACNSRARYTRQMMWCLVHLLKNSGCRPSEVLNLRRQDIEITNEPRWSETKQEWETSYKVKLFIRKSKTGKRRDVLCRSNAGDAVRRWIIFQNNYLSTHHRTFTANKNSLLFGKPDDLLETGYTYKHYSTQFRNILRAVQQELTGNRFSDRPYTLYSLRSTFIEDSIADGLDVYLVARLCGNSVDVIQRHYDRHDVLKRAAEVQALPIGKTKPPEIETIDLGDL